ncbi:MAG TPA: FecR domain-containing protein [Prolixibacteraceae bacterium]|nr:FecR domain-containing protein [Prolixibacteraceae bacterium]
MEANKFINHQTTEDFILDKEFVFWVLHPNKELDQFWESFIRDYSEKEVLIKNAILIIESLQPIGQIVPQDKLNVIFQKVQRSGRMAKFNWNSSLKYAAAISILIAIGSLIYLSVYRKNQFPVEASTETFEKGKVIFADGTTKEFDTKQTTIEQTITGNLTINSDTIDLNPDQTNSTLNQIIIPYGKRSEILLADGTHIWLNSGSQLSYPTKFQSDSRIVFLTGEAFFDVKANPEKPFYVITRDIKIKVLGTSFNVSSYSEDNLVQTVLIKGKVTAGKNKLFAGTIDLIPGERLTFDKSNSNISKDKVEVQLYSSWINGYLIFKNKPIIEVFTKLKRFYNQEISVEDGLDQITFSGKLYLGDDLKDVLENIAFASSVNFQENNGSYLIIKK